MGSGALTLLAGVLGVLGRAAITPDGRHMYFAGGFGSIFDRDPVTGLITFVAFLTDLEGTGGAGIALSPDGAHLYLGAQDVLGVYGVDGSTGALSFVESQRNGPAGPTGMALSPGGEHLYAACPVTNALVVFGRDGSTGALTPIERQQNGVAGVEHLDGPNGIAVTPDGGSVYVASRNFGYAGPSALDAFQRNVATGALTFVEAWVDGIGGVSGLSQAGAVVVSGDGAHVYATGPLIAVFVRNPATSALTYVETAGSGLGGGARGLAISPDDAHVYVAGATIAVFARNPATGALTPIEATDPHDVTNPADVAVSADGAFVYAIGQQVVAFRRDAATGHLTRVGSAGAFSSSSYPLGSGTLSIVLDPSGSGLYTWNPFGTVGVFRLDQATGRPVASASRFTAGGLVFRFERAGSVAPSPDGRHVYASNIEGTAITVFGTQTTCTSVPLPACRQATRPRSGSLRLTRSTIGARNRIIWKWVKGEATTLADLGDPLGTTDYAVCVYDAGGGPDAALSALVQGNGEQVLFMCPSCWQTRVSEYRFLADGAVDGIQRLVLRAGAAGRARVTLIGGGEDLPMPSLPLTTPVTVQLQGSNGECWQAVYSTAKVNRTDQFKARAD